MLAERAARSPQRRAEDERAIAVYGRAHCRGAGTVTAYASVGAEPPTRALLDGLRADGVRVLLPVVAGLTLEWGDYTTWTALRPGGHGVLEPAADGEATAAAERADVCLVPALAVDRHGHRLGRGAGFFDRWLDRLPARHVIVAVVYADEVRAAVPHEPHDVLVAAALTPDGVIVLDG